MKSTIYSRARAMIRTRGQEKALNWAFKHLSDHHARVIEAGLNQYGKREVIAWLRIWERNGVFIADTN